METVKNTKMYKLSKALFDPKTAKLMIKKLMRKSATLHAFLEVRDLRVCMDSVLSQSGPYMIGESRLSDELRKNLTSTFGEMATILVVLAKLSKTKALTPKKKVKLLGTNGVALLALHESVAKLFLLAQPELFDPEAESDVFQNELSTCASLLWGACLALTGEPPEAGMLEHAQEMTAELETLHEAMESSLTE